MTASLYEGQDSMNAILKNLVSVLLIRGVIQKAHTTTDFIVCAPCLLKILSLIGREIKTKFNNGSPMSWECSPEPLFNNRRGYTLISTDRMQSSQLRG